LQCVAVCCSVLQCVAVCCSALHFVAVRCTLLQYAAGEMHVTRCSLRHRVLFCVQTVCCSMLQCVALCCSVLQVECTSCGLGTFWFSFIGLFYRSLLWASFHQRRSFSICFARVTRIGFFIGLFQRFLSHFFRDSGGVHIWYGLDLFYVSLS